MPNGLEIMCCPRADVAWKALYMQGLPVLKRLLGLQIVWSAFGAQITFHAMGVPCLCVQAVSESCADCPLFAFWMCVKKMVLWRPLRCPLKRPREMNWPNVMWLYGNWQVQLEGKRTLKRAGRLNLEARKPDLHCVTSMCQIQRFCWQFSMVVTLWQDIKFR